MLIKVEINAVGRTGACTETSHTLFSTRITWIDFSFRIQTIVIKHFSLIQSPFSCLLSPHLGVVSHSFSLFHFPSLHPSVHTSIMLSIRLLTSLSLPVFLPRSIHLSPSASLSQPVDLSLSPPARLPLCPSASLWVFAAGPLCQDYRTSGWPTWTAVVGKQNVPLSTKPL